MAPKQILFTVLILAFSAKMGFAFQCRMCSGSMDECNNDAAKKVTCENGMDRCVGVTTTKDGKEFLMYGCASVKQCDTSFTSFCEAAEKNNVRAKCAPKCCSTPLCNTPPMKDSNLTCHMCFSGTSMDDCIQNSYVGRCTSKQKQCGSFTTEVMMGGVKVMAYRKGCQTDNTCKKENDLFGQACGSDDTCTFNCCNTDMCNAGSFSAVSVMSLFACAFLAFLNM